MPKVPMWLMGAGAAAAVAGGAIIARQAGDQPPPATQAVSQECQQDKAAASDLDKQIAALERSQLPADTARKMIGVIDQLLAGLKEVNGDTKKVIGPVNDAKKQLDEISENLKEAGGLVPPGFDKLKKALGGLSDDIEAGVKKYKKTPAGRAVDDVAAINKVVGQTSDVLESVKTGLEGVLAYDKAANGTGAEQVEALKFGFDQLKGKLALDEVPGLGAMLDAYSEALGGMAKSVGAIEDATKEKLKMADQALAGTDVSVDGLYPGLQTNREKTAARLQALKDARSRLQGQMAEHECDKPPKPKDPCTDPDGDIGKLDALIEKMSRPQREEYEYRQKEAERLFLALAQHSLQQPTTAPSRDERQIMAQKDQLASLQRGDASNSYWAYGGVGGAVDAAQKLADSLGLKIRPRYHDRSGVKELTTAIAAELDRRAATARKASDDAYAKTIGTWKRDHDELLAATKDAQRQRSRAKKALDDRVAQIVDQETKAKAWDKTRYDQFDECFPELGKQRRDRLPAPPPPPTPPASPPPAPTAAPPPPDPHHNDCVKGGGMAGAVNDVACKIGNGG